MYFRRWCRVRQEPSLGAHTVSAHTPSNAAPSGNSLLAELLTRGGAIQAAMLGDILAGKQHQTIEQYRITLYGS